MHCAPNKQNLLQKTPNKRMIIFLHDPVYDRFNQNSYQFIKSTQMIVRKTTTNPLNWFDSITLSNVSLVANSLPSFRCIYWFTRKKNAQVVPVWWSNVYAVPHKNGFYQVVETCQASSNYYNLITTMFWGTVKRWSALFHQHGTTWSNFTSVSQSQYQSQSQSQSQLITQYTR